MMRGLNTVFVVLGVLLAAAASLAAGHASCRWTKAWQLRNYVTRTIH